MFSFLACNVTSFKLELNLFIFSSGTFNSAKSIEIVDQILYKFSTRLIINSQSGSLLSPIMFLLISSVISTVSLLDSCPSEDDLFEDESPSSELEPPPPDESICWLPEEELLLLVALLLDDESP